MNPAGALFASLLLAAQLKAPPALLTDHGSIRASTTKGTVRWTADWTMDPSSVNGRKAIRFTETGKGQYAPFPQEVQWFIEATWSADGKFFPLHFEKTIRNAQGNILAVEIKNFDRDKGTATFERRNERGVKDTSMFSAPADSLAIEGIAGILQHFPFETAGNSATVNAHILSNEPKLYDIGIESRGIERLTTAAGTKDCYKLEMVPHLGLLNVFKVFYPKSYFWFSVTAPHTWVRYQGLENGPGSPEIVIEPR